MVDTITMYCIIISKNVDLARRRSKDLLFYLFQPVFIVRLLQRKKKIKQMLWYLLEPLFNTLKNQYWIPAA